MIPEALSLFFTDNQEILWFFTLFSYLFCTVLLYRLFGKAGLQVAIAFSILLANLQGPKLTVIFGVQTSLGVLFYASIFFATDVLSENYGKDEANKAVKIGFLVSIIMIAMMSLSLLYQPSNILETATVSENIHNAFITIVDFTPRFVLGSLLAYYISQRYDVWAFHTIKQKTGEKFLWLRNNLSTMSSQLIDTIIYTLVVWWSIVDLKTAFQIGAVEYSLKIMISLIDTGFIYWAKFSHKKLKLRK
ncbi:MAG: queuosine precursor transporter [Pseudomonadota bacterium]|nr:queuosine precursor transporter [Pseudomonadota bacterium]